MTRQLYTLSKHRARKTSVNSVNMPEKKWENRVPPPARPGSTATSDKFGLWKTDVRSEQFYTDTIPRECLDCWFQPQNEKRLCLARTTRDAKVEIPVKQVKGRNEQCPVIIIF